MRSFERLQEHINCCYNSLTNVGAEGLFQLQMHLRLSLEWAYNLEIEVARDVTTPEAVKARYRAIAKSVKMLDGAVITKIPEAIGMIHSAIGATVNVKLQ